VIEHVGRRTGRAYRTPVDAARIDDGFVVALPYGTTANWVRNVLATGSATVLHDGLAYRVAHAELVPLASMASHFTVKNRRTLDRFGVEWCVVLRTSEDGAAGNGDGTREAGPAGR
jgi:deazaflavin-dependent oxidoreductase (nitroreductase family)